MTSFKRIFKLLIVTAAVFSLYCTSKPQQLRETFFRMDTVVRITLVAPANDNRLRSTWVSIDSLLKDWEERFSQTHKRSEIYKVNSRKPDSLSSFPVPSPALAKMIFDALRYGDTLNGKFDITILPLKELWGFGEQETKKIVPDSLLVKKVLSKIGYDKISLSEKRDTLFFDTTGIEIDVGGIAKGHAIYQLYRMLILQGYDNFLIEAGGDILAKGKRDDGSSWRIGVQHPRKSGLLAVLPLDSGCIVTSGDYERFWISDNKRIHHIFNPRTGYSCTGNQSLTIWGMDPIEVDILSTGLFCLEKDSIMTFIEQRQRLECIVVDSTGTVTASKGWREQIEFKDNDRNSYAFNSR